MKLKKNIATSEAGLIFNPGSGDSFSVNNTGAEILAMLRETKSPEEIIIYLCSRYDVEKNQLEKDMDDFVLQLNDYNLLD
jgi:PqqD family protein of HPr-rel-A system